MRLQVKGKNLEVSESIRSYAEEKLGKLERQLADPTQVELELSLERNPSISAKHIAEATIWTKGPTLRAPEVGHQPTDSDEVRRVALGFDGRVREDLKTNYRVTTKT